MLKKVEAGAKTAELARHHAVSGAKIHNWQVSYDGLEISEVRRLRKLESESAKFKQLLVDAVQIDVALRYPFSTRWSCLP